MSSKKSGPFGPVKRIATSISPGSRAKLEKHLWAVYTEHEITQNAIMAHMAQIGESEECRTTIMYNGDKKPVFMVPFRVIMFLRNNKARISYNYVAYHKEGKSSLWVLWKEGMKSPTEILGLKFQGVCATTIMKKVA